TYSVDERRPRCMDSFGDLWVDGTEMKRVTKNGVPARAQRSGSWRGRGATAQRRSFCPLGENKQRGRESDEGI
ncbi:MAG: hypothetical protein RR580_05270, partial [Christensenellaceae bacterium]